MYPINTIVFHLNLPVVIAYRPRILSFSVLSSWLALVSDGKCMYHKKLTFYPFVDIQITIVYKLYL